MMEDGGTNAPLPKPWIVSVYNHKGGVGKTTSTGSLGWRLAAEGHRVLLVDGDPQCNLTGFLVDPGVSLLSSPKQGRLDELGFDPLETFYEKFPMHNLRNALSSVFDPQLTPGVQPFSLPPAQCFRVGDRASLLPEGISIDSKLYIEPPPDLYLLAGHHQFGHWDAQATLACESQAVAGSENVPGALYQLLMRTATKYGFDFVLVDLSPSSNTLNKLFVMSSHFLITPCSPDYFSLMAVEMLANMLPEWDTWMQQRKAQALKRGPLLLPPIGKPIFLGFTIQVYALSSNGSKEPAHGFMRWINRICSAVTGTLIPELQRRGMALLSLGDYPNKGQLASIRNFQSAGTASSQAHVPVFSLTGPVLKTITNSTHALGMVASVAETFTQFAACVAATWEKLPDPQKRRLLTLQTAVSEVLSRNYPLPTTEGDILAFAQQLSAIGHQYH